MRTLEKKLWPDYFDADRTAPVDFKCADFELEDGDQVRFREWDPKIEQYTGREYTRIVRRVTKHESPTRYWPPKELEKHGIYIIEWE